jgi:hypothetical protein
MPGRCVHLVLGGALRHRAVCHANESVARSVQDDDFAPQPESRLELTFALPKLLVQPRAISAVQVQHPLRYLSA